MNRDQKGFCDISGRIFVQLVWTLGLAHADQIVKYNGEVGLGSVCNSCSKQGVKEQTLENKR